MAAEKAAPCRHPGAPLDSVVEKVSNILSTLELNTEYLASQGMTANEYRAALPVAIERMRGSHAAKSSHRRQFLVSLFEQMQHRGIISHFEMPKYGDDTIYRLHIDGYGDVAIIQKGCPDGAHGSVRWNAPEWAKETYLWWLCSSLNYEPGEHVVKGVNRLRQRFFSPAEDALDGVIFHNELCGTPDRPCPKIARAINVDGLLVPPPCIYIMPEHDMDGNEWNWTGNRTRFFPAILMSLFGVSEYDSSAYIGSIGFQKRNGVLRNAISLPFGVGKSTNFRS